MKAPKRLTSGERARLKARNNAPTKCETAHTPLKRNSLKLTLRATAKGTAKWQAKRALVRVLDVIDNDTRTIH